ncbi:hypothetical protein Lsed01_00274 [Demequina sediminis]|uniref:Uncharacterized protein n=1 Tax=Demequina sediminis TaxID=1930058 RepID=A0ABP9WFS7_9MICO|nr:hypothetical protein [Demequina sediminis]BDZ60959.1 hypothetical protein GCM10025873_07500 [Demequina sediminis]
MVSRARFHTDEGVALVMAMGIALIAMVVAGVVVTATIVAVNDSGRDRVRTTEIHTAEGAVDATMVTLQSSTPCMSTTTDGTGAQATSTAVGVEYWDATGVKLTCNAGVLSGTPATAVITATSSGTAPQQGVAPVRKMQAKVLLNPVKSVGANAAIFSANGFTPSNKLEITRSDLGESADIWVDNGNWDCGAGGTGANLYGSVFVAAGSLNIGKGCSIDGDVLVKKDFTVAGNASGTSMTGSGNLAVGGATSIGTPFTIKGAAKLAGATPANLTALGGIQPMLGAAAVPSSFAPVGLPKIYWDTSKPSPNKTTWTSSPQNFTVKSTSDAQTLFGTNPCGKNMDAGSSGSPVQFPAGKTVYDLTSCSNGWQVQKFYANLNGDVAIIMRSMSVKTTFHVTASGDYKIWLIVPYEYASTTTPNDCSKGGMDSNSTDFLVTAPASIFAYSPGAISLNPHEGTRGQWYGCSVSPKNAFSLEYSYVGIPGYDLAAGMSTVTGYDVSVVYKREVS